MQPTTSLFELRGVRCRDGIAYPDAVIESGRATFVVGPSGCGKTTLLKLLNATLAPTSGTVLYRGDDVGSLDALSLRREVVLASQNVFLFDQKTVAQNFDAFFEVLGRPAPQDALVDECLALCCLDAPKTSVCQELSGGQRQRVSLAICAALRPTTLLLDEPTSALDAATASAVLANLKRDALARGASLVVVSHDPALVEAHADDVLDLGKAI